jgi:hypothetical protein
MTSIVEVLKNLSNPTKAADFLFRLKGFKKIAQILRGYIAPGKKDPSSIINALPKVIADQRFKPFYNIYKHSSYYQARGFSVAFANQIARYL